MRISLRREHLSAEEEEGRAALKEAQRRLNEVEKVHERQVKDAHKGLKNAKHDHERLVKDATKTLENKRRSNKLGSLAGVTLYDDQIVTPDGSSVLSPDVRAAADTAGNLQVSGRVTVTRLATLGLFAFALKKKKTNDTRELYLVVETPEFMTVRSVDPKLGNAARQFAAQIVNAGKQGPHVIEQKRVMAQIAERSLHEAESDRRAIEEATETLREAEADTAGIEQARQEVESLTAVPA